MNLRKRNLPCRAASRCCATRKFSSTCKWQHNRWLKKTIQKSPPKTNELLSIPFNLANRHVEIKPKGQNGPRKQNYENYIGCILKIRELNFSGPKFDSPAFFEGSVMENVLRSKNKGVFFLLVTFFFKNCTDWWPWRRRLEPHRLPVCRLNVLCGK